jgi:hypothetical protein
MEDEYKPRLIPNSSGNVNVTLGGELFLKLLFQQVLQNANVKLIPPTVNSQRLF